MLRALLTLLTVIVLTSTAPAPGVAQVVQDGYVIDNREKTGGAQTLEDIIARQKGVKIDDSFRRNATGGGDTGLPETAPLGTLGGASDPELWRALRYNSADVIASSRTPGATVLVQEGGMWWLDFRAGPLRTYGGWLLLGTLGLLALFLLLRGRIRIEGPITGVTLPRFNGFERFTHWMTAVSFVLLGISGLITLFGRVGLIPYVGKENYAVLAQASKWVHNNVSWAFMLGIILIFVLWVVENIPNRHDVKWLMMGGGIFSKGKHPPAKKFNAGQKMIFWAVILLGVSVSASGLSLLFPFEVPMFAATFAWVNDLGLPHYLGMADLPGTLAPHEEMQFSQLWHSIVAFVFMAVILAHIYLGTIGMEGAFDAMGSGRVEKQWAKEHHSIWYEELTGEDAHAPDHPPHAPTPAE
ncbi:formate dehydrogenase subunit gamma [Brevirhabdus pacifica]|uniref:Formate dehydrogenase subunit gamma n=2 Tax=Brevirhabdus pacifica TaxID=1267768 RepID=A0A1U7DMN8_9RHOB|nr:formate dehydrogenase subunit gamma [Brevirhabdus pacifica]OWU78845.1 formate dehydrogenase [Loktanella sp. 22II-4b]